MHAASVRRASLPGLVPLDSQTRQLSDQQLSRYLDRLQLDPDSVAPDWETLVRLQAAHTDRIAYENIDIQCALPPPELTPALSAERVAAGRGGYCFILVDAFAALLCSIGFKLSMHTAGVGEDPLPADKWGNHIVLVVHLNGQLYVADVGLGDGPRHPFEVRAHSWEEAGYRFRLEQRGPELWRFHHDALGSFKGFDLDLSSSAVGAGEFTDYHRYYYSNPQSAYRTSGAVLQRVSPEHGVLVLRNCTLRRIHPSLPEGGSEVLETANNAREWFELVREWFLLVLDDLAVEQQEKLWQTVESKHHAWATAQLQSNDNHELAESP